MAGFLITCLIFCGSIFVAMIFEFIGMLLWGDE